MKNSLELPPPITMEVGRSSYSYDL